MSNIKRRVLQINQQQTDNLHYYIGFSCCPAAVTD